MARQYAWDDATFATLLGAHKRAKALTDLLERMTTDTGYGTRDDIERATALLQPILAELAPILPALHKRLSMPMPADPGAIMRYTVPPSRRKRT